MSPRPRLLCVTARRPAAGVFGDALRSWHLLRGLSRTHRLTLIYLDDGATDPADDDLHGFCEDVIRVPHPRSRTVAGALLAMLRGRPAQCGWFDSPALQREVRAAVASGLFDAAFVQLARLDAVMPALAPLPVAVDLVDALSLQWQRRGAVSSRPWSWFHRLEAARLRRVEAGIMDTAAATLITGVDDARHLESLTRLAHGVEVLPNGVDVDAFRPRPDLPHRDPARPVMLFSGNLDYQPNAEAVRWFATAVLPLVRARVPGARFVAAGKLTREALRLLADSHGVEFTGFVADLAVEIAGADVCVAPMVSGAGIQNKVLEAMACGRPVVATRLANAGIAASHGREILIAADPGRMADVIVELFDDPVRAGALGAAGRALVLQRFSWQAQADIVADRLLAAPEPPVVAVDRVPDHGPSRPGGRLPRPAYVALRAALHGAVAASLVVAGVAVPLVWAGLVVTGRRPRRRLERWIGIDRRFDDQPDAARCERRRHDLGGRPFHVSVMAPEEGRRTTTLAERLAWRALHLPSRLWHVLRRDLNLVGPRPLRRPSPDPAIPRDLPSARAGVRPGILAPTNRDGDADAFLVEHAYRLVRSDARHHLRADARALRAALGGLARENQA